MERAHGIPRAELALPAAREVLHRLDDVLPAGEPRLLAPQLRDGPVDDVDLIFGGPTADNPTVRGGGTSASPG